MLSAAAAASFDDPLLGNIARLLIAAVGMLMTMLCLRVGWLRWRNPHDANLQARSPMALLSYATFAAIPTGDALSRIGQDPNWLLIGAYALALSTGIAASFSEVTIRLWWRPKHRAHGGERP